MGGLLSPRRKEELPSVPPASAAGEPVGGQGRLALGDRAKHARSVPYRGTRIDRQRRPQLCFEPRGQARASSTPDDRAQSLIGNGHARVVEADQATSPASTPDGFAVQHQSVPADKELWWICHLR